MACERVGCVCARVQASIEREVGAGGAVTGYVLNGLKWWTSGACDPRCKVAIFMGKTDPQGSQKHLQQSMVRTSSCALCLARRNECAR